MTDIQQQEKVEKFLKSVRDEVRSVASYNWSDEGRNSGLDITRFMNFIRAEAIDLFSDWVEQGKLVEREYLREEVEWWAKEHIADTGLREELIHFIKNR